MGLRRRDRRPLRALPQEAAQDGFATNPGARRQKPGQDQGQTSLAEQYFFRLVKKSKGPRMVTGGILSARGASLLVVGIDMAGDEDDVFRQMSGAFAAMAAILSLAVGTVFLVRPSPAARESRRILAIPGHTQREGACEKVYASAYRWASSPLQAPRYRGSSGGLRA